MDGDRFIPDFRLQLNGAPVPAELRASVSSVTLVSGLEGADRVEITLVNDKLRWLDQSMFALDTPVSLQLGYTDTGTSQVFVGQIVGFGAAFPSSAAPTVTITAQDARYRMAQGNKVRWFAIPTPVSNLPLPDIATASLVALENLLVPLIDPVGAALSVLLGDIEVVAAEITDPGSSQKFIRKQANESDYDFLTKIAKENGWEMAIDHDGPLGGHKLHFFSPLGRLDADIDLAWGASLIEFTPRITNVGQIFSVSGYVWVPPIKMVFNIILGFDWDRMALTLVIYPGGIASAPSTPSVDLIHDPLTLATAPRKLVSELIPKLNKRLTATGTTLGDPGIIAGKVLRITGVGVQFGGLWRVTEATHTLDSGGYHTHFELRKEIWFGSIPPFAQGALPVRVSF
jgi:phage protein D